jgi:hypothetical protein
MKRTTGRVEKTAWKFRGKAMWGDVCMMFPCAAVRAGAARVAGQAGHMPPLSGLWIVISRNPLG